MAPAAASAGRWPPPRASRAPARAAFGHTGFTGTSLWIDPDAGHAVVLLTNRVHPRRGPPAAIHGLRVAFHEAVRRGLAEAGRPA